MSNSKAGQKITAKEKNKSAATKRRGKCDKAANTDEQKKGDSVPVDLEDYKGARKKLRDAVKAVVKNKSVAIAETLVRKVEKGDMRGTEVVLSLIEKKKQGKDAQKKVRSGPSWAELLASEPEWDESMEDDKKPAEVGGGDKGLMNSGARL
ncbi:MAG: hypothetical protein WAL45_14320 [Terracidiphilus sp.]